MKEFLEETSLDKLEKAVEEIEKSTSAEIVITIARMSAQYREIPFLFGFIFSMVVLILILFVPWDVHLYLVVPITITGFFVGHFLAGRTPLALRLLTGKGRKKEAVERGAKLAFFEENVSATKDRTGILFYISLFERQVEILADLGIDGKITSSHWNELSKELTSILQGKDSLDKFTEKLLSSAKVLNKHFPPGEENPDEISNRPRVMA